MHCKCGHESVKLSVDAADGFGWIQRCRCVHRGVPGVDMRVDRKKRDDVFPPRSRFPSFPDLVVAVACSRSLIHHPINKQARSEQHTSLRLKSYTMGRECFACQPHGIVSKRSKIARRARCRTSDEGKRKTINKKQKMYNVRTLVCAYINEGNLTFEDLNFLHYNYA